MDEVEKYQQRLQAIAEKRRLQEEQDRAKRHLDEEKLRLQQMKRKSLRDQWLMEGPPLSPDSAGPRSPLWGTQAQQAEANINKLQSEVIEKTQKHKEDSSTSEQSHTDHHGNREKTSAVTPPPSGSSENGEEKSAKPSHDTSLTNGTAQGEESHDAPLQHVTDVNTGAETLLFLGYVEAEPGQGLCEDADDVSEVIHAERVIIMEEGEEVTEELHDTQVEQVEDEEQEEEREEEEAYEEKGGEEKGDEEIKEKKEEIEDEQGEEQEEGGEEEREEANDADFQNHLESGEVNAVEEEKRHTGVDLLNEDSRVNLHTHTDEETSVKTDADTDTNPNTGFKPDADPAAETLPPSLSECAVSPTQTASGLNQNTAQKSPELNSSSANTAAHFHEIPLGGATVEEEPLLAAKAEPLSDAANPNRGEVAKTTTCRCCTVM